MSLSRSPQRQVVPLAVLIVAWLAVFAYLGLASRLPEIPGLTGRGESLALAGHFGASLVLAALLYAMLRAIDLARPARRIAAGALVGAAAVGGVIELLQALSRTRTPEVIDWGFDLIGAVVAIALLAAIDSRPPQRRRLVAAVQVAGFGLLLVVGASFVIFPPPSPEEVTAFCPPDVDSRRVPRPDLDAVGGRLRVDEGLVAFYDLSSSAGDLASKPSTLDLELVGDAGLKEQGLRISGPDGLARTTGGAAAISQAVDGTRAFTVETWARPRDLLQRGPARIVSMSASTSLGDVNLHVGQERTCLSFRVRSSDGGAEWLLTQGVFIEAQPVWHLLVTYDVGEVGVYVDGSLLEQHTVEPWSATWNPSFDLLIGNEATLDRPFVGDVFLVAVYDRALSSSEVLQNFAAGPVR